MNIELPLDGKQRAELQGVSDTLFHSEYMLEALLFMAKEPRFFKGQLAKAVGCQANFAATILRRLEDGQLVERVATEEGQRRHYFQKRRPSVWAVLVRLAETLLQEAAEAKVSSLNPALIAGEGRASGSR